MSAAIPRVIRRGWIDPRIKRLAQALGATGQWRVTSCYRAESPNHGRGVALDTAPITAQIGGFTFPTARRLWEFAKAAVPDAKWIAVSEADHVHLQLAAVDCYGWNRPGDGLTELKRIDNDERIDLMSALDLQDRAYGDLDMGDVFTDPGTAYGDVIEQGDASEGDVEALGYGDLLETGDLGFTESGAPVTVNAFRRRLASRDQRAINAFNKLSANKRRFVMTPRPYYEHLSGGAAFINSDIGVRRIMGESEIVQLRNEMISTPAITPSPFPFVPVGPTYEVDINAAMTSVTTIASGPVTFAGMLITMTAPVLSAVPATPVSVARRLTSINTLPLIYKTQFTLSRKVESTDFLFFPATIVSGRTRRVPVTLTDVSLLNVNKVTIVGLGPNYVVTGSFVMPGDARIDRYARVIMPR